MDPRLDTRRRQWETKAVLREVYADLYRRMAGALAPGPTLEIGGGSGNLKAYAPQVCSTDVLEAPWLDAIADAQALPFAPSSFSNIVMFDVLHHLVRPRVFFSEAIRVLQKGGRLVMVEPAITPVSGVFYRFLPPEPVVFRADPLAETAEEARRDAFEANQAVPTLLFRKRRVEFQRAFPQLVFRDTSFLSLFTYPHSGGFRSWSLIPSAAVPGLLRLEDALLPILGPLMAFRMFVVLERT
ncbi:MAG: class I SAM-dependent methyltransferase [Alphaproteobacteria bacterium]|nr:class I SAM-dependent methyltransferase [Alphaproteobacteria bacterium]